MIKRLSDHIPLRFLCKTFGVSPAGYYDWKNKSLSARVQKKSVVLKKTEEIFEKSKGTYGSPRIFQELRYHGYEVSENTVAKYMKELGLMACKRKRYRIQTTNSKHSDPIAPRLFKTEEGSLPTEAGKLLAGDITYLSLGDKFYYLAVVLDLYNREVLGWSLGESLETALVLEALGSALKKVKLDAEIIFHSDRGVQYASEAYRNFLKNKKIRPSMSRKGNCYDNAYVESWFASFKKEWLYRHDYSTMRELRGLIFEYIETWYNKRRRHSSLEYLSPEEYKRENLIA